MKCRTCDKKINRDYAGRCIKCADPLREYIMENPREILEMLDKLCDLGNVVVANLENHLQVKAHMLTKDVIKSQLVESAVKWKAYQKEIKRERQAHLADDS